LIWIVAGLVAAAITFVAVGWYATTIFFNPPKMLPLEIYPDRFNFPYESVEFRTSDGLTLRGWLIPAAIKTQNSLMLCHGWGDNKGDMLERTDFLRKRFNLFYFDFRHHGDSEGDRTSLCGLETRDITSALACLRENRPQWASHLGIFGYSMGCGVGTWLCANEPAIKALLCEAPFWSFNGVLTQWAKNAYPHLYIPMSAALLTVCRWRLGMDAEQFSPIYHIDRVSPRPVFIITGENDQLMLLSTVQQVYIRARDPKELWVVPLAKHGKCRETAGAEYERRIIEFFEQNL
jgi:pimeloyl-ACP methyl ester carboxylesterase